MYLWSFTADGMTTMSIKVYIPPQSCDENMAMRDYHHKTCVLKHFYVPADQMDLRYVLTSTWKVPDCYSQEAMQCLVADSSMGY
jgi:hypothetical protein